MPKEGQWRPSFLKALEAVNVNSRCISLLPHLGSTKLSSDAQGESCVVLVKNRA